MNFIVVYEYATYIHSYIMYTKLLLIYYLQLILYAGNYIIRTYYSETTRFLVPTNLFSMVHSDPSLITSIV